MKRLFMKGGESAWNWCLKRVGLSLMCCMKLSVFGTIQEELSKRVELGYNKHLVAAEISEKNILFYHAGNFSSVPEEALFEIGSITKLFTAHLTFILEQEGILSIQDPVKSYLPASVRVKKNMQIHHLLTHSSGIEDPLSENYNNPETGNTVRAAEFTIEQLYDYLGKQRLFPGEKIIYSNLGYALLGHILERASGKKYETLLLEKILIPFGMHSTYVTVPLKMQKNMIQGTLMGKSAPYWNIAYLPGFASLKSTAKDLATYCNILFLEQSSFWKKPVETSLCTPFSPLKDPCVIATYGLTIDRRFGGEFYAAAGNTLGFSSFLGFDPHKQRGIILLTDASSVDFLGHHFLHSHFPLQPLHKSHVQKKEQLTVYEGVYSNQDISLSVLAQDGYLKIYSEEEPELLFFPMGRGQFFSYYLDGKDTIIAFNKNNREKTLSIFVNGSLSIKLFRKK